MKFLLSLLLTATATMALPNKGSVDDQGAVIFRDIAQGRFDEAEAKMSDYQGDHFKEYPVNNNDLRAVSKRAVSNGMVSFLGMTALQCSQFGVCQKCQSFVSDFIDMWGPGWLTSHYLEEAIKQNPVGGCFFQPFFKKAKAHGASVSVDMALSANGYSPLMHAASTYSPDLATLKAITGPDVEGEGPTPWRSGDQSIRYFLRELSSEQVNAATTDDGTTALMLACMTPSPNVPKGHKATNCYSMMRDARVQLDAVNHLGQTALILAAKASHAQGVDAMFVKNFHPAPTYQRDVDHCHKDSFGKTAKDYADEGANDYLKEILAGWEAKTPCA